MIISPAGEHEEPLINNDSPTSVRRSTAASAIVVSVATAVSAVLGFGREMVSAHYYGTSSDLDAFLNASTVPLVLFGVFNGSLTGALVPTFSEYASTGRHEDVRRLGSTVINLSFILMAVLAAIGWFAAPYIVAVVAHGFSAPKQELEVGMVRWLLPSIVATTLSGVCGALLNANHKFVASSLNTVASNIVVIVAVVFLERFFGIYAIVFGSILGVLAQLMVQLPSINQARLYQFSLDLHHPGLAKAMALFIPVTLGAGAWQINLAFDRYFASTLSTGSTAAISYATKVAFLPVLIVAGAIGTVIFPLVAGQFANADHGGIRRSLSMALRMIGFIVLPCAAGLVALAHPIVQTLFQRGAFGPSSTAYCASLIPFACLPLVAISYNTLMIRAAYACKQMKLAVTSSFIVVGMNIGLSAALLPHLGARGLLLANGLSMFVGTAFLFALLWRVARGLEWRSLSLSIARTAVAASVMCAMLAVYQRLAPMPGANSLALLFELIALILAGAACYLALCRALGVEETVIVARTLLRKFTARTPTITATPG